MDEYQSLSHTVWDCKYHVVWTPKCRRKTLHEQLRNHLGQVFRTPPQQKGVKYLKDISCWTMFTLKRPPKSRQKFVLFKVDRPGLPLPILSSMRLLQLPCPPGG